jgi:hypothetical protein
MITADGYIETLDEQEAITYGNYIVVTEDIELIQDETN